MVSLSARRAWIETALAPKQNPTQKSLSARRAWIETVDYIIDYVNDASLSAMRAWIETENNSSMSYSAESRSPQGERG